MSTAQAANKGVHVYKVALKRRQELTEAYIKGLDYIIDKIYGGDVLGQETLKAIRLYERKIGV